MQPPLSFKAVEWRENACYLLDQTRLPSQEIYLRCESYTDVVKRIQSLSVRGAPAIGVAGAYAGVLAVREAARLPEGERASFLEACLEEIAEARPTAVNLRRAVSQLESIWREESGVTPLLHDRFLRAAEALREWEDDASHQIAEVGARDLPAGKILTYCNTGALAAGGPGTALGVILEAYRQGKVTHTFACETRPLLQGLRLTAWELARARVPFTVLCDNMVGSLFAREKIAAVVVGADRIARNGDVANKIGTYGVAVLARHHRVPFYVAAPSTTFDLRIETGADIPIEERAAKEITGILGGGEFAPPVWNPAFDVTPRELVTAYWTESGAVCPPFTGMV